MKMIKEMSKEEYAEYKHHDYMKHKKKRKEYQRRYYYEHHEECLSKVKARYRNKVLGGEE